MFSPQFRQQRPYHESLLTPSLGALKYHMLRSEFVLKVIFSCCANNNINFADHGWRITNDKVEVVWDDTEMIERVTGTKGCGCKGAKCDGTTAGCMNCYKMCKACTIKCKCKSQCRNPHNNGGTCPRCAPADDNHSDDNSDQEDEQNDNEVPIIPPSHSEQQFDTDSDSDDEE